MNRAVKQFGFEGKRILQNINFIDLLSGSFCSCKGRSCELKKIEMLQGIANGYYTKASVHTRTPFSLQIQSMSPLSIQEVCDCRMDSCWTSRKELVI